MTFDAQGGHLSRWKQDDPIDIPEIIAVDSDPNWIVIEQRKGAGRLPPADRV
jgi:hypothetical protein